MKEWYQTKELVGLAGLPGTIRGINHKAKVENWLKRKPEGIKGRAYEYHIDSIPREALEDLSPGNSEMPEPSAFRARNAKQILMALILESDDSLIEAIHKQVVHKGMESLYVNERDKRMLDLVADCDDEEFKEIFAFIRKAKYALLAGYKVDPAAINSDLDIEKKKQA